MPSEYTKYACDLYIKLNDTEKQSLLYCLIQHMTPDNKKKLLELSSSKAFILVIDFLESYNLISSSNSDLLISAFESVNRDDLAKLLAFNEMELNISAKRARLNSTPIKSVTTSVIINNLSLELNFKPHKFQLSLAQLGCDRVNNVIVVRTGSGKTLVSVLICKYWQTFFQKQKTPKDFKAVFVVPTRFLANQQSSVFEKAFHKECLQEINEKADEKKIFEFHQSKSILFLTAQKLINTLKQGYFKVTDLDVIIFDEVHHCDLKHPYNQIMKIYFEEKLTNQSKNFPLVIGLTASLGVGDKSKPLEHLIQLCSNLDCKEIAWLSDKQDQDDLEENIPSVINDNIETLRRSNEFEAIQSKVKSCMLSIASTCKLDGVTLKAKMIGEPEFESFLSNTRESVAANCDSNTDNISFYSVIFFNVFLNIIQEMV